MKLFELKKNTKPVEGGTHDEEREEEKVGEKPKLADTYYLNSPQAALTGRGTLFQMKINITDVMMMWNGNFTLNFLCLRTWS